VIFPLHNDDFSAVAKLGTGSVVAWEDPDANNGDIEFRIFDAAGAGGAVQTANTDTTGFQAAATVATSPDGAFFAIAWGSGDAVKARVFDAAGSEVAPEFPVTTPTEIAGLDPAITWLNTGQFAVTWSDRTLTVFDVRARLFDLLGRPLTGVIPVNSTTLGFQSQPSIAALPDGGFVVAWVDNSGVGIDDSSTSIRLQAFDASGGKIGR